MKSKQWVTDTRNTLQSSPPEVVVLGNSMVGYGFDDLLFGRLSNSPTISIWREGAASAWYYMALKNLIHSPLHLSSPPLLSTFEGLSKY